MKLLRNAPWRGGFTLAELLAMPRGVAMRIIRRDTETADRIIADPARRRGGFAG